MAASYYIERTKDVLMPLSLPSSVGVSEVHVNMGKLRNSGYEFSISAEILKTRDMSWLVTVNGSRVIDTDFGCAPGSESGCLLRGETATHVRGGWFAIRDICHAFGRD